MAAIANAEAIDSGTEDGIEWKTVAAAMYGAVNGYVRVPDDHPWHGRGYDDIPDDPSEGVFVDVHGGLTYADNDGWIGFDTLHAGDCWPGSPDYVLNRPHRIDWTPEMVAKEARRLAQQIGRYI